MVRRFALPVLLVAVLASGCFSVTRRYTMPITAAEGQLVVPAIVSVGEGMGLRSYGSATGAQVQLEDGTWLYWNPSGEQAFVLSIDLADESRDTEVRLRDAHVRADQIWQLAVEARQANALGASVVVQNPPPPVAGQPAGPGYVPPPPTTAAQPHRATWPDGYSCMNGADCQSGVCKSGRCGAAAQGIHGTASGQCSFDSDCGGRKCRFGKCVGGAPGADCSFGSDCPSGSCRFGKCQ